MENQWIDDLIAKIRGRDIDRRNINRELFEIEARVGRLLRIMEDHGARLTGDFVWKFGIWNIEFTGVNNWPHGYHVFFRDSAVNSDSMTVTFTLNNEKVSMFEVVPLHEQRGYPLLYVDMLSQGLRETAKFLNEVKALRG